MVASSNRIRFWSAEPPRTLKPDAPSPALVTPGSNCMVLSTSGSPKTAGVCKTVFERSRFTLISGFLMFTLSVSSIKTTSSSSSAAGVRRIFCLVFSTRDKGN